jgi:hypothetical protein
MRIEAIASICAWVRLLKLFIPGTDIIFRLIIETVLLVLGIFVEVNAPWQVAQAPA